MPITAVEGWNGPGSKDAELTKVTPSDNALHPHDSKWAFEHWYFDARLDSGHTVVAFLQKRRPEERPGSKPVVELLVYYPDGSRKQVIQHYPKAAFRASDETCEVAIGPNKASADLSGDLPVHHLHAVEDDLAFDLTFTNETPVVDARQRHHGVRRERLLRLGRPRAARQGQRQDHPRR